jgi:hypothetical protein
MMKRIIDSLVSMFGRQGYKAYQRDMLTYAKTEYANDWEFAYHYMLNHNGRGPKMGVYQ